LRSGGRARLTSVLIFRFDPEVSVPVSQHGSSFRIGSLVALGGSVRVQVLHLGADGLIGRHEAASQQLVAAVAGSGWVSGGDGERRGLRTGYAALWDDGESHETGTESGMTLVCVEGDFTVEATRVTQDIVVVEHDPAWAGWFEHLYDLVWPAVEQVAIRIDHVGSTSVEGLAAKPVIDMDVVVASESEIQPAIDGLGKIGYRWRGDLGVEGRQAFSASKDRGLPRHHLYLVVENNKAHIDHWLLRDTLRADPEARRRYGDLKRRNVELARGDMDVYVAAKARFVAELLTKAREERGLPAAEYWDPDLDRGGSS
jgi:GrpB-like predicted nucleotidyltransferase (UPF0157 family)